MGKSYVHIRHQRVRVDKKSYVSNENRFTTSEGSLVRVAQIQLALLVVLYYYSLVNRVPLDQ
jgi:hypothetical protein